MISPCTINCEFYSRKRKVSTFMICLWISFTIFLATTIDTRILSPKIFRIDCFCYYFLYYPHSNLNYNLYENDIVSLFHFFSLLKSKPGYLHKPRQCSGSTLFKIWRKKLRKCHLGGTEQHSRLKFKPWNYGFTEQNWDTN